MNRFGNTHTTKKLEVLENYLKVYTKALKDQSFKLAYFDAFAGSGKIQPKSALDPAIPTFEGIEDAENFILGSAERAVETDPPFDIYQFVDRDRRRIAELEGHLRDHKHFDRCEFEPRDANEAISSFCATTNWREFRAVMFLDPFGSQVSWETLKTIAGVRHIDLWYLFPAGLSVNRQIAKSGKVHETHVAALNRIIGDTSWQDAFIRNEKQMTLFGQEIATIKDCDPGKITDWMIKRLDGIFEGGAQKQWLPLGPNRSHWYSLIFAVGNPAPKAAALAHRLAKAVMK